MRQGDGSTHNQLDQEPERELRRFFRRWYRTNGRWFPWREPDVSPFGILVAEMLLRQTRAEMVAAIWPAAIMQYPTPQSWIEADSGELYALLANLGLGAQRVVALQSVTAVLVSQYGGVVPRSISALAAIPHLGLYSAHAIACFAYNRRVPVVDVNVLRLFSRLAGEDFGLDNRRGRAPEVWEMSRRILPSRGVKEHNYGLLDFCAQVCRPRHPAHAGCPLSAHCVYYRVNIAVDD